MELNVELNVASSWYKRLLIVGVANGQGDDWTDGNQTWEVTRE